MQGASKRVRATAKNRNACTDKLLILSVFFVVFGACRAEIGSTSPGDGGPAAPGTAAAGAGAVRGGSSGPGAAGGRAPRSAAGGAAGTGPGASGQAGPGAPVGELLPARIRRLTNREFDASVNALLGIDAHLAASFTPDTRQDFFTRNDAQRVDPVYMTQLD